MDISGWLGGLGLGHYEANFRKHAIDETVLDRLTAEDLKDIGVSIVGHRRKLLDAIAALAKSLPTTDGPGQSCAEVGAWDPGRRQLTVLCCDLVNSTALAQRLDPEDMSDVIREVLRSITSVATQFGGYVAKFTGDGALVYFGYPHAHEDDAERAVRAALGTVAAVRDKAWTLAGALSIRVGIATGRVVVGELVGEGMAQERGVVGETPALAARLQAVARPGEVVIGPETRHLLGSLFELEPLGPQMLKGFGEPVEAWSVVCEVQHVSRFEARTTEITPLIGREQEVALLLDRWRRANNADGQAVLLSGEGGIGKSRIVQAIRELIRSDQHWVIRYQCSPHHSNEPFYPVIGQLWQASGFVTGEQIPTRLGKIEELIDQSSLSRDETVPYLASLLSIPTNSRYKKLDEPPSVVKDRTIDLLIEMMTGLARNAPVFFILEDAHWIDPTTLELISRAIDRLQGTRVLSVITFRPDFAAPWAGRPHVTALSLNRLGRGESEAMIRLVVAGKALPPELADQIVAKTDGVPLFIEELTKAVLDSGLVRTENDSYVLAGALTPLAIPSTLEDSLMARLDRLAPVKEIAQIGAAIGREFSYSVIESVAPMPPAVLRNGLRQLVNSELIYVRRGSSRDEQYVFKHALVQDTAYASLLRGRRQRIHADIARTLTEKFPDQAEAGPEIIAHHYTEAGLPSLAAPHWLTAAERALARSANTEGARYAETGLALISKIPESPERRHLELGFQLARCNAFLAIKGYTAPETVQVLTTVKGMLDTGLGTDIHRFSVLYGLWAAHYVAGRIKTAQDLACEYLGIANHQNDATFWMIGHRIYGAGLIASGQPAAGLLSLKKAEQHYDPPRHKPLSYRFGQDIGLSVLCHEVWALWFLGKLDRAKRLSDDILAQLPDHGHATTIAFCTLYGAVFPAIFANDFDYAARLGEDLAAYCTKQKMGPNYATAGRLCSYVGRGMREPSPATIKAIRCDLDSLHNRFGVYVLDSPLSAALAQILLAAGEPAAAETVLQDGITFAENSGERYWLPELHRLKGRVRQNGQSDLAAAKDCFTEAMEIAKRQEARPLELRAATDLIRLNRATGSRGEAEAILAPLLSVLEGGDTSFDVQNARALLDIRSSVVSRPHVQKIALS